MRYAMLIYANEAQEAQRSPEEQKAIMGGYYAFTEAAKASGNYISGAPLQPVATATTVREKDGAAIATDGPFAETREQLGGFYIMECKDLDEAIALAAKIPAAAHGSVEVRPIWVMG